MLSPLTLSLFDQLNSTGNFYDFKDGHGPENVVKTNLGKGGH